MNKHSILWAFLSIVWIGAGSTYVGNLACAALDNLAPLSLKHNDFEASSQDHFQFGLSSADISFGPSTELFFTDISNYLQEDKSRKIALNGLFLAEELNHTTHKDLGTARGESMKSTLIQLGAGEEQIEVSSEKLIKNPMVENVLYDGVVLTLKTNTVQPAKKISLPNENTQTEVFDATNITAPKAKEYVEPMTLYGDAVFSLDVNPSMQHYIDKIGAYLSDHPDAALQITGHTQELGSIVKNADRSLELARKVRRFFRNNGINYRRIKTNAKGATEPILTHQYPQAETKNNRVEIKIIE